MNDHINTPFCDRSPNCGRNMTLKQVMGESGVTCGRERQIQNSALLKLHVELERRGLTLADVNRD